MVGTAAVNIVLSWLNFGFFNNQAMKMILKICARKHGMVGNVSSLPSLDV